MSELPQKIVFRPDALGEIILDPAALPILEAWRDGQLQPVVCRALLVRYLRLLNRLRLPPRTVRWWGWWLGSPKKATILPDPDPLPLLPELCLSMSVSAQAIGILYRTGHPPSPTPSANSAWLAPKELIHHLRSRLACTD